MPGVAMLYVNLSDGQCPRCGNAHRKLAFRPLTNPPPGWGFYATCPTTQEPIIASPRDEKLAMLFNPAPYLTQEAPATGGLATVGMVTLNIDVPAGTTADGLLDEWEAPSRRLDGTV